MKTDQKFDDTVLRTMRRMARRGDTVVATYQIGRMLVARPTSRTWDRVRAALSRLRDRGLVAEEAAPWYRLTTKGAAK